MANSLTLDVGEDRILLQARSTVYRLDIYLPYDVIQEDVGAQFNRKTKVRRFVFSKFVLHTDLKSCELCCEQQCVSRRQLRHTHIYIYVCA